ncbi:MAG: hypothetical protein MUP71_08055, partial [Candidatus Aminicenantes bacterium]|nr:hypothetical protein [Candidatus Aminicenantes bacterium]
MFTLVENGTVITPSRLISDGGVLCADGMIRDIGRGDEVRARFFAARGDKVRLKVIDAKKRI